MIGRGLCLTAVFLAACIFAGNWLFVTYAQRCDVKLEKCQCYVRLTRTGASATTTPSCSLRVTYLKSVGSSQLNDCSIVEPGTFDRIILCDTGIKAVLHCQNGKTITVNPGTASEVSCVDDGKNRPDVVTSHYESWVNNVGGKNTNLARGLLSSGRPKAEDEESIVSTVVTPIESLTVTSGDAGIGLDRSGSTWLTVAAGRAELVSLCSGRAARLTAPAITNNADDWQLLPVFRGETPDIDAGKCRLTDISGNWRGGYLGLNARREPELFPLVLQIRQSGGTVTAGGRQMNISELRLSTESLQYGLSISFNLEAASADGAAALSISGTLDKGNMQFFVDSSKGPTIAGSGTAHRLHIAQSALPKAAAGAVYQQQLYAVSTAPGLFSWTISDGVLPPGISLDPNAGTLAGTPSATGKYNFSVRVSDANGDVFVQPLTLEVNNMVLVSDMLPAAFVGQSYSYRLEVAGGKPPYTFKDDFLGALPVPVPGLPFLSADGTVKLEPQKADSVFVLLSVRDSNGLTQPLNVTIPVRGITLTGSQKLPDGQPGAAYDYAFKVVGTSAPVTWSTTWDLDGTGLTFDGTTGRLSGRPVGEMEISFTVTASDGNSPHSRPFDLSIVSGTVTQAMAQRSRPLVGPQLWMARTKGR